MKITKRILSLSREQLYALKNERGKIINNKDEVIKIAEKFFKYNNEYRSTRNKHNLNEERNGRHEHGQSR